MHLAKLYKIFDSRCKSYDKRKQDILNAKGSIPEWKFNYLTEVLISDVWQSWTKFCRSLIIYSCKGTKARDGAVILKRSCDNHWKRITYEAKSANQTRVPKPNGHLNFQMRDEPTWGDIDVFLRIVSGLAPSNSNVLLTTYGSFLSLKDLQMLRNACAHKNVETVLDLNQLSSRYNFSKLKCATELAWAVSNSGTEYAIELWLYEMNLIADYATSSN